MPDEKRTEIPTTRQPIALQNDSAGNLIFEDHIGLRRWVEQRIKAGGLPKHIQTAEQFESVYHMLAGLGVNVMASVGNTMIVNGVVGIWGDLPEALCRRTGLLKDIDLFWVDQADNRLDPEKPATMATAVGAVCKVVREGETPKVRSFTLDQARTAGLLGKPGPWQQYPRTMLGHRARALALRAAFPDALKGVPIREADEYVDVLGPDGRVIQSAPGQSVLRRKARQEALNSQFKALENTNQRGDNGV